MRLLEEQKQVAAVLKSVYESILFHGIYAKYTRSVTALSKILNLDDSAELHYIMMHLSRLSYLKSFSGEYVWASGRYAELLGSEEDALLGQSDLHLADEFAEDEFEKMETEAYRFHQISSTLIDTNLKGRGHFTCHAKVYPVYNQQGEVVASLSILAEVASHKYMEMPAREEMSASALLI